MTQEDWLELINKYYNNIEDDDSIEDDAWIPAYPEIKEKVINSKLNGITDLTTAKKNKIINTIIEGGNIKVHDFLIITRNTNDTNYSVQIYEESIQEHLGRISKMQYKLDLLKDVRFSNRPWLKYFNHATHNKMGVDIDVDTLYDIVKWLQIIKKLTAFL